MLAGAEPNGLKRYYRLAGMADPGTFMCDTNSGRRPPLRDLRALRGACFYQFGAHGAPCRLSRFITAAGRSSSADRKTQRIGEHRIVSQASQYVREK